MTPFQISLLSLLSLFVLRNFDHLLGLSAPEPLANLYNPAFFRATWVTTAMDAGFWTAMDIPFKPLRDLCSVLFTGYYLVAAEAADRKVRKTRGELTLRHLRVSWNKGTTPYLGLLTKALRPKLMPHGNKEPKYVKIARPQGSKYSEPIDAWLYFDGTDADLAKATKIVLDAPGGGFISMSPRTNDDKLMAWAGLTGLPILSLDYKKAPEYPYPYALNEVFDAYRTLVATRGKCAGLSGSEKPKIIITGDSAGGNLAVGTMLLILLEQDRIGAKGKEQLYPPEGIVLIYPGLDFNMRNWMAPEHMEFYRTKSGGSNTDEGSKVNQHMLHDKNAQYSHLAQTGESSSSDDDTPSMSETSNSVSYENITSGNKRTPSHDRLAMTSMISYVQDRIISPEMLRAMILLYVGPHNAPDFSTDYFLSPGSLAPMELLERFPPTRFLTGERDPLVDDTVIFAGRLRKARRAEWARRVEKQGGLKKEWDESEIQVAIIPGISHGFLQFVSLYPDGRHHIARCARWISEIFQTSEQQGNGIAAAASTAVDADLVLEGKSQSDGERRKKEALLKENLKEVVEARPKKHQRQKSGLSLASEEDIIGRRMVGLTGKLHV
jgi:acetyl esterase/lipase